MEDILEHQPLPPHPPKHTVQKLVPRNGNSEYYRKYSDCEENTKGFAKHLLQKEKVDAAAYFIKVVI